MPSFEKERFRASSVRGMGRTITIPQSRQMSPPQIAIVRTGCPKTRHMARTVPGTMGRLNRIQSLPKYR